MRATDPRTRIWRRLAPATLVAALLTITAAQASEEVDPGTGAAPPGAEPAQSQDGVPPPTPVPSQEPAPAPAAEPAPPAPAPAAQPPVRGAGPRAGASATRSVRIVDFAFQPASITVDLGDTVRWTNEDAAPEGHDVTGDGLDSGLMNQGDTYLHTFDSAGTVNYICTIHPGMKGTVEVRARSGGSGAGAAQQDPGSAPATPVPGSESAAVASPEAAGGDSSLPATGEDLLAAAAAGLGLLILGLALRRRPSGAAASDWLP